MYLSNMVFSSLKLSRHLDEDELIRFEKIDFVNINDISFDGGYIVPTSNTFVDCNTWTINGLRLEIEEKDKQHFFIETLVYLINNFFKPIGVKLNGNIFAIDHLFGSFQCYFVKDSHIMVNMEAVQYFESLEFSKDINTNLLLIAGCMKEIIDKN
jgi:hypothetical protein